jgi:predicted SPOUT superfamily RNA methylase MTH1
MGLPEALGRPDAGVRIATSRHGEVLSIERLSALVPRIEADGLTVAFGAPGRGLPEILDVPVEAVPGPRVVDDASGPGADAAPVDPDDGPGAPRVGPGVGFDRWLNTIPNQGSEVVRTEEAVIATLATLGLPRR